MDNSIYQRINNKWYQDIYNADTYFNPDVYKDLLRYKRIVEKRIRDGGIYPCSSIHSQDIISKITLLLNK